MASAARFLAYGDSLTAGYHSCGRAFSPYASALAAAIGCPASVIDVCGASGLQATQLVHVLDSNAELDVCGRQYRGLRALCRQKAQSKQYEVVLIMLGTNDLAEAQLGLDVTPESICQAVRQLHEVCHADGVRTVALPILPNQFSTVSRPDLQGYQRLHSRTNELLKEWAEATAQTVWVDVTAELPWSPDSDWWEPDGLHLAPAGSEKLGRSLGEDPKLRQWLLQP